MQKIAVIEREGSSLLSRHIANTTKADDTRIAVERTIDEAVMRAEYEEALAKAQLRQVHAQEGEQAAERRRAERRKLADRFEAQVDELVRGLADAIESLRLEA